MAKNCHKSSFLLGIIFAALGFLSLPSYSDFPFPAEIIPNERLIRAYIALQAWKLHITSDPQGFTSNWEGPDVCSYNGVFCAPALDDPTVTTVAGIDLNHAGIYGCLPQELGLLTDLALFHLNSNSFYGSIPETFASLQLLFELDLSNNLFGGPFPCVVFDLPSLKYLDLRFNKFKGGIPPEVFDMKLDALFINDNDFETALPENLGNSTVSVFVAANVLITGCIPPSVGELGETLNELILSNLGLNGCFREELERVKSLKVLDLSSNNLEGPLPEGLNMLTNLEVLNVEKNKLRGPIPPGICELPKLKRFSFAYNFFDDEPTQCLRLPEVNDRGNCIPDRPNQRSPKECRSFISMPINCRNVSCS